MAVPDVPERAPSPFEAWGRLTRFLESARVAFARERDTWASLGIRGHERVRIAVPTPHGKYSVSLRKHIDAIEDADTLHGAVLVYSYAVAESAAAAHLGAAARSFGGIEDWGSRLLEAAGADWVAVTDGLAGAVEVAVVRNAFVHGSGILDAGAAKRLLKAGAVVRPEGSRVTLTYTELKQFRGRLLSLLNAGGVGSS